MSAVLSDMDLLPDLGVLQALSAFIGSLMQLKPQGARAFNQALAHALATQTPPLTAQPASRSII